MLLTTLATSGQKSAWPDVQARYGMINVFYAEGSPVATTCRLALLKNSARAGPILPSEGGDDFRLETDFFTRREEKQQTCLRISGLDAPEDGD